MRFIENKKIFFFLSFLVLFTVFISARNVSAIGIGDWKDKLKIGAEATGGIYNPAYGEDNAVTAIAKYVGVMLTIAPFLGYLLLVRLVWGGYQWMMARGNEEEVENAKKTIKHAIIGLAIFISLYVIAYFVVESMKNISGYQG